MPRSRPDFSARRKSRAAGFQDSPSATELPLRLLNNTKTRHSERSLLRCTKTCHSEGGVCPRNRLFLGLLSHLCGYQITAISNQEAKRQSKASAPLYCHPDRNGPIFSFAPLFGASGRGVEGSAFPLLFPCFSANLWALCVSLPRTARDALSFGSSVAKIL